MRKMTRQQQLDDERFDMDDDNFPYIPLFEAEGSDLLLECSDVLSECADGSPEVVEAIEELMEVTSNLVAFGSDLRFVSQGLTAVAQYVEEGGGEAQNTAG